MDFSLTSHTYLTVINSPTCWQHSGNIRALKTLVNKYFGAGVYSGAAV